MVSKGNPFRIRRVSSNSFCAVIRLGKIKKLLILFRASEQGERKLKSRAFEV